MLRLAANHWAGKPTQLLEVVNGGTQSGQLRWQRRNLQQFVTRQRIQEGGREQGWCESKRFQDGDNRCAFQDSGLPLNRSRQGLGETSRYGDDIDLIAAVQSTFQTRSDHLAYFQ
jgi:hypothetical protein